VETTHFRRFPRKDQKKSQADKPAWPFWLKLSAGGQLDGYFEYVAGVVAGVSFF
jgi:hypothetical protein